VDLVQLDVSVSDRHGAIVPTLTATDFVLKQDGHFLPVQLATFVGGRASDTRFIFYVDDYHIAFENFVGVREGVMRFVTRDVPTGAEMLVMPASFFGEKAFTFTTNPAAINGDVTALSWGSGVPKIHRGGALGSCDGLTDDLRADMFGGGSLSTLTALLSALQQIEGRKAVVLLTDGLVSPCRDQFETSERLRRITDLANRGSSVLYAIDTRPVGRVDKFDEDLQYLADRTGGLSGRSNDIESLLTKAARDQDGYYLVAYEPPPATFKKGRLQYREVKISLRNPELHLRSRAGFYSVPDTLLARH
jgi:VWFA-related protein